MNPSGLIWAGLQVANLEDQVAYYREVLGLRLIRKSELWAVFDAGNGGIFELSSGGQQSAAPKTGEQQSLVVGFRVNNLPQVVQSLQGDDVTFISEIESYKKSKWIKFVDPEGNILELKEVLS